MSLPQRPLLPNSSGTPMDDKASRIVGGYPSPATSSPSSVFPVFPPNFQHVYNSLMQAHFLQIAQQQQHHIQQQIQQNISNGLPRYVPGSSASPTGNSDQAASSRSVSPQSGKLVLDEDGCATCPACAEKIPETEWITHLEEEKQKLVAHITNVRENRCRSTSRISMSFDAATKRETELQRIRNNQQKRQILKRGTSHIIRDCLTPFSRQSNDETGSSESPDASKKEDENFNLMKCSSCSQPCVYAIIMSSFDRPKCQMCFDIIRTQSCVLTSTSPSAENEEINQNEEDLSPVCKKIKIETSA